MPLCTESTKIWLITGQTAGNPPPHTTTSNPKRTYKALWLTTATSTRVNISLSAVVHAQTTHERNAGTCYSCKDGSFLSGETPSHIWTNKLELQCAKYPSRAAGINLAWFNINSICYKRLLSLLKSVKLDAATVFSLHLLSPSALPTARQCFCRINMQKLL